MLAGTGTAELDPEESLTLLLTDSCDLCGHVFVPGEEFHLLKRVRRVAVDGQEWGEVLKELAFCAHECGGQQIIEI